MSDRFLSEQGSLQANAICEKALRAFFTANPKNQQQLKSGEWYEARVSKVGTEMSDKYSLLFSLE